MRLSIAATAALGVGLESGQELELNLGERLALGEHGAQVVDARVSVLSRRHRPIQADLPPVLLKGGSVDSGVVGMIDSDVLGKCAVGRVVILAAMLDGGLGLVERTERLLWGGTDSFAEGA